MRKNMLRKSMSLFLALAVVVSLLPAMTLPARAAYPDPYSTTVNTPLALSVSELSGLSNFSDSNYYYVEGYTQPAYGTVTAQLYYSSPGDMMYMASKDSEPIYELNNDGQVIYFLASQSGSYTFDIHIKEYNYSTDVKRTIAVNVSGGDTAAPTATMAAQTVAGGGNVTVQSTETGTVYLIGNALAPTAYDTLTKLDNLVTALSATKVTITAANADTTIAAPPSGGTYAAVAVDAAGNISSKTANLVTVDTTAPTATVAAQTVAGGANVTVQSTETGTVYLIGSALAPTAYDTQTKLDNLVTALLATKVSITAANTDTTITAPMAGGTYAAVAVDAVGNVSSKTANLVTVDGTAPTVTITSTAPNPTKDSPFSVTITFSENVTGFVVGDITVGNGTAGNFVSTDAKTYTADIAPGAQGAVTVNVAAGVAIDAAGNGSTAATQLSRTFDNIVPTVTITSAAASFTNSSPIPVTITFSENVTGFLVGDITVGNGTAGNLSGSGTTYTADITPGAQGAVTVNVAAGVAIDAAGNSSTAATQLSRTFDDIAPTAPSVTSAVAATNDTTPEWTWTAGGGGNGTYRYKLDDSTLTAGATETTAASYTPSALGNGSHTLYVQERDAAGNWSVSGSYTVTVDGTAPSVTITSTASNPTNDSPFSVTITFSENVTGFVVGDITVGNGTAGNFVSTDAKTYTADIAPGAQGAVTVNVAAGVAIDAAGNGSTAATQLSRTFDNIVPTITSVTVSTDHTYVDITFSEGIYGAGDGTTALTAGKLTLTFAQNSGTATNVTISSIKKNDNTAEASASALSGGETTVRVFLSVTGTLSGAETAEIKPANASSVYDATGNSMASTQTTGAKTLVTPVSYGGNTGISAGAQVIVNGKSQDAGTSATTTDSSGQITTTVTVDTDKLQTILDSQSNGATVIIPVTGGSDVAAGTLTGEMVKSMESVDATLVVQTDSGTYTLPASQINIDAVSQQLGTNVSLSDISVTVSISEPSASMTQVVENAAQDGGFTIMVPAVEYSITCTHGSQTVNVSSFNAYVERTIAIPNGVDPAKITTGVVVDPDGTVHHVPTRITVIDGKYYAVINSLTNSTYSVVWNFVDFSDVADHWAKEAINDMGSRLVVSGVGNNNYAPDRNMTRAEFAAVMVRALGLEPGTGESGFGDASSADWYSGYIKTAEAYGIAQGYDNKNFGPNDTITREQAMTMIARAMKITGLTVTLTDSDVNMLIGNYADGASASDYAKDSIAACLETGITSGTGETTISPKADITRAEVAVMVKRLLQTSGLI